MWRGRHSDLDTLIVGLIHGFSFSRGSQFLCPAHIVFFAFSGSLLPQFEQNILILRLNTSTKPHPVSSDCRMWRFDAHYIERGHEIPQLPTESEDSECALVSIPARQIRKWPLNRLKRKNATWFPNLKRKPLPSLESTFDASQTPRAHARRFNEKHT